MAESKREKMNNNKTARQKIIQPFRFPAFLCSQAKRSAAPAIPGLADANTVRPH